MTNEQQLAEIKQRLDELEQTIATMNQTNEQRVDDMNRAIGAAGFETVGELAESIRNISIIVLGEPDLGIEPLRPMVIQLQTTYERAKWVAGSLVTMNLGTVAAWINTLLK